MESLDLGAQLGVLTMVSWILLVPVGLLLIVTLFKVIFLLHGVNEFLSLARYELYPTLKDLRQVVNRAELLSEKAVTGVEHLEKGLQAAGEGVGKVRSLSEGVFSGVGGAMGTVVRSMWDALWERKHKKEA